MGETMKSFMEMNNRELFCVLTGDRGIMAQTTLQQLIRSFIAKYPERDEADLMTMVHTMAEED